MFRRKRKLQSDNQTGFGVNATSYGGRFLTKDGNANVHKTGLSLLDRYSVFHSLIDIPRWKFLLLVLATFIAINLVFTTAYYYVGIEHLNGINAKTELEKFGQAFFFSAQTFTTVGYGHISPNGFLASSIAAIEALLGLLSLALATGLLYGRFSRPQAYINFSDHAVIAPFNGGKALMLRLVPFKNTNLLEVEAKINLGIVEEENGLPVNKFYRLDLEYDKINVLTLSWTLVHPIDENSPLYDFTSENYEEIKGEIMVFIKAFDDKYSNTVMARTSYTFKEVIYGAKFLPMFNHNTENNKTMLHLHKLNDFQTMEI